ncbi:YesL family protein [Lederbergia ruris]|uniref:YesL family protein n=1 Tax=Lederbergia ruris TaxID=217495 RepID=UPI0039A0A22E
MAEQGWKNRLVRFAEWFSRLAYINLLWIGFTLLGVILLGFIPSTIAMFGVLRKWMKGELEGSVFGAFWTFYRQEFLKSNVAAVPFLVIGYIMYVDVVVFDFGSSMSMQILKFILYLLAFLYVLIAVYFFPVYVQYELKWYQYLKLSVLMAFATPFRAIWMVIIGYGVCFLMAKMPIVMLFFLGSAIAYLWLMIALPAFYKLERREKKLEN